MRSKFLPFSPPMVGEEEIAEVVATLRSDWITTGPKTQRFEAEFADFVGASSALALSSCTGALHLSLLALGIGKGDRVLTTPMTFCSTVHVIEHVGAEPVLVDVEPDTLNLDPVQVGEVLSGELGGSVKAVFPVHLYGHPANMGYLDELAERHGAAVVEDAAHALPASLDGRLIGAGSKERFPRRLTCFSFYATKNLTTAEGGMLTGDSDLVDEARLWSLHGMSRDAWKRYDGASRWYYEVTRPGFKYNMTDLQAAMGIHQLRKLSTFHARRKAIARLYDEGLSRLDEVERPTERPSVESAWHIYPLRLHLDALTLSRDDLIEELRARKIGTSVHFIPVHLHPYYRDKYGFRPHDFPVCYREYQRLVSLPLHARLTDEDVRDVIEAVTEVVGSNRKKTMVSLAGHQGVERS